MYFSKQTTVAVSQIYTYQSLFSPNISCSITTSMIDLLITSFDPKVTPKKKGTLFYELISYYILKTKKDPRIKYLYS